jgi:predicted nucleic acid-binding protein
MSAGIDAMVVVYAGIAPSKPETRPADCDDLHLRSKLLLLRLSRDNVVVTLPAIAVSELLVPVADKGMLIAALQKRFVCRPFDLPASAIAAELWAKYKSLPQEMQYDQRHVLKADAMIVATAKAGNVTDFYSHDKNCRKMAELAGMKAHDLPNASDVGAGDLFSLGDVKRGEGEV